MLEGARITFHVRDGQGKTAALESCVFVVAAELGIKKNCARSSGFGGALSAHGCGRMPEGLCL